MADMLAARLEGLANRMVRPVDLEDKRMVQEAAQRLRDAGQERVAEREVWTCMSCGHICDGQSCDGCGSEAMPGRWIQAEKIEERVAKLERERDEQGDSAKKRLDAYRTIDRDLTRQMQRAERAEQRERVLREVLEQILGDPQRDHTHAERVPCHPACQAYNLPDALLASLKDGHAELTQHYNGGEEELLEHLDSWLDEHGSLIDQLVTARAALAVSPEQPEGDGGSSDREHPNG